MIAATPRKRRAGTIMAELHAAFMSMHMASKGVARHPAMKIWVKPPPKLPRPAAVTLAVPATLGANAKEYQIWLVTKVAPAQSMSVRIRRKLQSLKMMEAIATQSAPEVSRQQHVLECCNVQARCRARRARRS
jgi:hypothetical protein